MSHALIGHTGFVGSTLKRQTRFEHLFNRSNIKEVAAQAYHTVARAEVDRQPRTGSRLEEHPGTHQGAGCDHLRPSHVDQHG